MNRTDDFHFSPIRDFHYDEYFQNFLHNGKVINDEDRNEFIKGLDESIAIYSDGLPMLKDALANYKDSDNEFIKAYRTVLSVVQFVVITSIDCLVIGKYFLLADKDYDKRFMRGKMKVILNEGFKKLYGFNDNSKKKSEWNKLSKVMKFLPENVKCQYNHLTELLERHATSSLWWKDDRDVETHLDTENLYESRCADIVESKVMIDSVTLFSTLYAMNQFLTNVHSCFHNTIVMSYQRDIQKCKV